MSAETQMTLFPDVPDADTADAVAALTAALPGKQSMTVQEAAAYMSCSRRTVENWITDGTLLATYANREGDAERKHARAVVRADRAYDPDRKKFLTLEELRVRRSNVSG